MNDFFKQLIESYTCSKLESYNTLCSAVEGFIPYNSLRSDFNPYSLDYDDVEYEIIFIVQELLEHDYGMLKRFSVEQGYVIDDQYLHFDTCTKAFVIDPDILFDELDIKSEEISDKLTILERFVDQMNTSTTLKLLIQY